MTNTITAKLITPLVLRKLVLLLILFLSGIIAHAQATDSEGCKDHPFFNRYPKFYIQDCSENYDEVEFWISDDKAIKKEGTVTRILYTYDGPYGPNLPSRLQIIKNYENAILSKGGKKIYSDISGGKNFTGATFTLKADGKEYWVSIHDLGNNPVDYYKITILALEEMEQVIEANRMFEQLEAGTSVALHINFETGKSTIMPDSQHIIDELAKMLKENSTLTILIEGHTDNVGSAASNQQLSEQRAESVKKALVQKGISAHRMATIGFGQSRSVADNGTDEGRAKNRRVEIRKI